MHLVGYETVANLPAMTAITPIPDPTLRITGNDFLVPQGMNNVVMAAAACSVATGVLRAQLQSPSLRSTLNIDISPITQGLVFGAFPRCVRNWYSPFPLVVNEPLDMYMSNGGAATNRAFLVLADGAVKPVTGKIYTVRATASAALVTGQWINSPLTFQQTLPAGHYQVVGFRSVSANQVAARIFFVGSPWRPGVLATTVENDNEDFYPRFGNIGVFGEFDNTVPPTIDFVGITDVGEAVYLDLIKTA